MSEAGWSIALGILVFLIAIIFAAIYYFRYKRIYLVILITSIATYIFAVFYTWEVFELNTNWILLMLVMSTIIMTLLGRYFSKIRLVPDKAHTTLKEKEK